MCEKCFWYQYPLLVNNSLRNKPIPNIIQETRVCMLGGCDGSKYEARQKGNKDDM